MRVRTMMTNGCAVAACMAVAACGGGGDHVASTPTPPAAPSYDSFTDLNRNVTLQTSSTAISYAYSTFTGRIPGSTSRDPKGGFGDGGITIGYDAASRTYTLHDGSTAVSYAPADKVTTAPGPSQSPFETYGRQVSNNVTDTVLAYRVGSANTQFPQLSYATFVIARHETITSLAGISDANISERVVYAIGGFETVRSDLPKTGTASYSTYVTGTAFDAGTQVGGREVGGSATITADFGAATLNTSLALTADGQSIGTFTGAAPIETAASHFKGDLTANGATQGNFSGAFFGPQGTEVGYTYRVQSSIGTVDGGVVGKK